MPGILSDEQSAGMVARITEGFATRGFGFWAVEKLGMSCEAADDFDHPLLPADHHIRPHVLFRLSKQQWALRDARR